MIILLQTVGGNMLQGKKTVWDIAWHLKSYPQSTTSFKENKKLETNSWFLSFVSMKIDIPELFKFHTQKMLSYHAFNHLNFL